MRLWFLSPPNKQKIYILCHLSIKRELKLQSGPFIPLLIQTYPYFIMSICIAVKLIDLRDLYQVL
jgi:hypothetical protein